MVAATVAALAACSSQGPEPEPEPSPSIDVLADPTPDPAAKDDLGTISDESPAFTSDMDEYSEVGAIVDGFPTDLLPVPDGAVVLVSSAIPLGTSGVYEVSLNLRTSLTAAAVAATYRESLTAAGFEETLPEIPSEGLAAESTFTRSSGDELLIIGVLDADTERTVTIGGRIRDNS